MTLQNHELIMIEGGNNATVLNAISRFLSVVVSVGRMVGSSLRRIFSHSYCKL